MLVPRENAGVTDASADIPIDISAAQLGPSLAADRFLMTAGIAVAILIVVGLILLFRHRRTIARAAGDKSIDALAAAVKAKRNLSAKIEERIEKR